MSASPILRRWFAVASALAVSFSSAVAGLAGIEDKGEFFSATAEATAQRQIADLQRSLKKDFAIETFATIPAEAGTVPATADKAAMNRFMEHWAEKQAAAKRINGVYTLLVKSPAHLQVVVGNDTQAKAFTLRDRDELVRIMLGKLRTKDFDGALTEGVSFVASTMRAHATGVPGALAPASSASNAFHAERQQPAAHEKSSFGWLVPLVVIGLGVWLIRALIRAFSGGSSMNPGMGNSGGGGFMSSMLGGLFGAAAGMWMYDQFFGNNASAHGPDSMSSGQDRDSGFSGEDSSYSGSGDSFGDDSGSGNDSGGGGDFGGGDSGGDSGGGGDF